MPDGKPGAVEALDAFFSADDKGKLRENYRYARDLLEDQTLSSLPDVTDKVAGDGKLSLPHGNGDARHFRSHWFNTSDQVEQEMRRRYKEAIDLAEPNLLPIETFWETGSQIGNFEIRVTSEAQRVTVRVRIPQQLERAARQGWPPR
jgi:hypothetical protein